jgi:hypothetical protein
MDFDETLEFWQVNNHHYKNWKWSFDEFQYVSNFFQSISYPSKKVVKDIQKQDLILWFYMHMPYYHGNFDINIYYCQKCWNFQKKFNKNKGKYWIFKNITYIEIKIQNKLIINKHVLKLLRYYNI